jgi:hypothetical protein
MPQAEIIRRALVGLNHASDEEIAGYIHDAFLIRVHPKQVAAVRRSRHYRFYGQPAAAGGPITRPEFRDS